MLTERIQLYETEEHPYVDAYILDPIGGAEVDKCRGAVIIAPGGGYLYTTDREGEPVAMKFAAAGYHAFVLHYRVSPTLHPAPLEDLARTILMLRKNSEVWHIDQDNITVCGFSAGGHLAASLGVYWNHPFLSELVNEENELLKPNRLILGYPVISMDIPKSKFLVDRLAGGNMSFSEVLSLDKHVSADTPPTFLWHTACDDAAPVENSLIFAQALSRFEIPFEMHIFPFGPHGQSVAEDHVYKHMPGIYSPDCAQWVDLALKWMKKRCAVEHI